MKRRSVELKVPIRSALPKTDFLWPCFVAWIVLGTLMLADAVFAPDRGLQGCFYSNPSWNGRPVSVSLDAKIYFKKPPLYARSGYVDEMSAVWEGFAFAPKSSAYRFSVRTDGAVWIYLDGSLVLENKDSGSERRTEKEISLSRGNHALLIRTSSAGQAGLMDFFWREVRTTKKLRPRLYLYPRPVSMAVYVLDATMEYLRPLLRAAWLAAAVLLILGACRTAMLSWPAESVLALGLFCALLVSYAAELDAKKSTAVWGCDTYAYLQGAEFMAEKGLLRTEYVDPLVPSVHARYPARPTDHQFIFLMSPHGYYVHDRERGTVYNLFPPGVSWLLYPFVRIIGRGAAFFVVPVLNLILFGLFFSLGTKAVDAAFGLCLSAFTFFNFHVFENSLILMSDVPSMGLLAAGAYLLYRNIRRPRLATAVLSGVCFGLSLVLRYSNAVGIIPLAGIFLLGNKMSWPWRIRAKQVAAFSAGVFTFGVLPLMIYTHRLFGTFFRLVYEPISQSRFQTANLPSGLSYYLPSVWRTFGPFSLALAAVGLAALLAKPRGRAVGIVCVLAFLAFFGFHVFHSIQNERYLLPAYPFLGFLFAFGAREILTKMRRYHMASLFIVALCAILPFVRSQPAYRHAETEADELAASLASKVEPGGVVFCDELSGSLRIYEGIPGYRFVPSDGMTILETAEILTGMGRPAYFYVDNPLAEEPFRLLLERTPLLAERLEPVATIRGRVLYRFAMSLDFQPAARGFSSSEAR